MPERTWYAAAEQSVQGRHGRELILGEVFANGTRTGHHHWNRLPDGRHIDLTADQFRPDEAVVGGQVQQRPPGTPDDAAPSTRR